MEELMHRVLTLTLTLTLTFAVLESCGGANAPSVPQGSVTTPQGLVTTGSDGVKPATVPVVAGCQMFPANNPWNTNISSYPLDSLSGRYIAALPGHLGLFFGAGRDNGIPFNVVPSDQPKVSVSFTYFKASNPGPYPIPPDAQIQGGPGSSGDRHVLVVQQGVCKLYEMFKAYPSDGGKHWSAGSGAIFPLNTNKLRPNGWTSADAAGLPITPALVKCAEVQAGVIHHAMRVTFERTQAGFIHPATHYSSYSIDPSLPPMGLRFRLKASYDISGITGQAHVIAVALKNYGMLVADDGPSWEITGEGGTAATCWDLNDLEQLTRIPNTAFEVVKTGPILRTP
jgi:hypothetical protein